LVLHFYPQFLINAKHAQRQTHPRHMGKKTSTIWHVLMKKLKFNWPGIKWMRYRHFGVETLRG
jgi:hypothetical protein